MLDTNMKTQLKAYLEKLTKPVELIATLDDSAKSAEIKELLTEIAELSEKVTFKEDNTLAVRKPSFLITNPGSHQGPRFAGSPLGHEFTSLVLALLWTGGHPSKEAQSLLEQIRDSQAAGVLVTHSRVAARRADRVLELGPQGLVDITERA